MAALAMQLAPLESPLYLGSQAGLTALGSRYLHGCLCVVFDFIVELLKIEQQSFDMY